MYETKLGTDLLKIMDNFFPMTNYLIRKRCFEKLRFMNKYYLIVLMVRE